MVASSTISAQGVSTTEEFSSPGTDAYDFGTTTDFYDILQITTEAITKKTFERKNNEMVTETPMEESPTSLEYLSNNNEIEDDDVSFYSYDDQSFDETEYSQMPAFQAVIAETDSVDQIFDETTTGVPIVATATTTTTTTKRIPDYAIEAIESETEE